MDPNRYQPNPMLKAKAKREVGIVMEEDGDDDVEEEEGGGTELGFHLEDNNNNNNNNRKKKAIVSGSGKKGSGGGGGVSPPLCQAEKCGTDLTEAKRYHRRHKVCEVHAKAAVVVVAGLRQRFCQQCSRFHELSEFDEAKRSCRRRLAGHNERRRKSSSEFHGEGSSHKGEGHQLNENQCRQADERGRVQITLPGNSTYKHFQIR